MQVVLKRRLSPLLYAGVNAGKYYAENYETVRDVVNNWQGDGVLVQNAKNAINQDILFSGLVQLQRYNYLPEVISKLEDPKTTIVGAYKKLIEFMDTLDNDDHVKL